MDTKIVFVCEGELDKYDGTEVLQESHEYTQGELDLVFISLKMCDSARAFVLATNYMQPGYLLDSEGDLYSMNACRDLRKSCVHGKYENKYKLCRRVDPFKLNILEQLIVSCDKASQGLSLDV
jgi:hypothetical protein